MRVVEDPNQSKVVPADEVFSYDGGKPAIGNTFEAHHAKYTILGDGRIREEGSSTLTMGRRFFLAGGHIIGQTDYNNGKVVFRCVNCETHRVATASSSPLSKKYILGWFMHHQCNAES